MRKLSKVAALSGLLLLPLTACASTTPAELEQAKQDRYATQVIEGTDISSTFLGEDDAFFYTLLCVKGEATLLVQDGSGVSASRQETYDPKCAR